MLFARKSTTPPALRATSQRFAWGGRLSRYPLPGWGEDDRRKFARGERRGTAFLGHRPIERVALLRLAADPVDQLLHGRRRKFLAVLRASGARDAFVHQRAA